MKKIYRELIFREDSEFLNRFVEILPQYANDIWHFHDGTGLLVDYLIFSYYKKDEQKYADLSIYCGYDKIKSGELCVNNIVPVDRGMFSVDEYNEILLCFYEKVIKRYMQDWNLIEIIGPTSDMFDLHMVMDDEMFDRFIHFCMYYDRTSSDDILGTQDKKNWYSFVCASYDSNKELDLDSIVFGMTDLDLCNEFGYKPINLECAIKLANRYEIEYGILKYYGDNYQTTLEWGTF